MTLPIIFSIARDKDNSLCLYSKKPKLSEEIEGLWVCGDQNDNVIILPPDMFPEVTFENSPQQVELKLFYHHICSVENSKIL